MPPQYVAAKPLQSFNLSAKSASGPVTCGGRHSVKPEFVEAHADLQFAGPRHSPMEPFVRMGKRIHTQAYFTA